MRSLSATECISPAIQRAKDLLARPFQLRIYLKLTALAFFAEIGGGSCNFSSPANNHGTHGLPAAVMAFVLAFAVLLGIVALVIWLVMLYVTSRLQLVLVEVVATRQPYISPFWRKQGPTTWRWLGVKLLYSLAVVAVAAVMCAPFIYYAVRHQIFSAGRAAPIGWIVLVVALVFLLLLVAVAVYAVLRGLAVPAMALEGVSASEAIRRARFIVDTEPGQVALFVVLQLLLTIAMAIAAEILIVLTMLISLVPFALVGGGAWFALRHAGTLGTAILIGLGVSGCIVFVCWMVCIAMGLLGPVYVFSQAYALYFLGGRYPLLGDLLDQTTPVPEFLAPSGFVPPVAPPEPGLSM